MIIRKSFFSGAAVILFGASKIFLFSSSEVTGVISQDAVWTHEGSPYIVKGNILVAAGASLLIEPGVEVKFDGKYYFKVDGKLTAVGTENERIVFTSNRINPSPGDWEWIELGETVDIGSIIQYCFVEYAHIGIRWADIFSPIVIQAIKSNSFFLNKEIAIRLAGENQEVIDNFIFGSVLGIKVINLGHIKNNRIENCSDSGICVLSDAEISSNTIVNNAIGITIVDGQPVIEGNNIYNNSQYDLKILDSDDIAVSRNYWEATEEYSVKEKIYDFEDDYAKGRVNITGFASEPYENTRPGMPGPPFLAGAEAGINGLELSYSWEEADDDIQVLEYDVSLSTDGKNYGFVETVEQNSFTLSAENEGSYRLKVSARDSLGSGPFSGVSLKTQVMISTSSVALSPEESFILVDESGSRIEISSGTVSGPTSLIVRTPGEIPEGLYNPGMKGTSVAKEISFPDASSLLKEILIVVTYRDSDLQGVNEQELRLCYYNPLTRDWVAVNNSETDTSRNCISARVNQAALFRVMEYAPPSSQIEELSNYPNPFEGGLETTKIRYLLAEVSGVKIAIYDLTGSLVWKKTLNSGEPGTGAYPAVNEVEWDGKNGSGQLADMGSYICVVESAGSEARTKIGVK